MWHRAIRFHVPFIQADWVAMNYVPFAEAVVEQVVTLYKATASHPSVIEERVLQQIVKVGQRSSIPSVQQRLANLRLDYLDWAMGLRLRWLRHTRLHSLARHGITQKNLCLKHVSWQGFSNMASDWLAACNQKPCLKMSQHGKVPAIQTHWSHDTNDLCGHDENVVKIVLALCSSLITQSRASLLTWINLNPSMVK